MPRQPRNPKYIATLALVSASILIGGSLLRPERPTREQPTLTETEMTRLQRITQRQELDNMADFFVQVANDVQPSIVRLPNAQRSGVIWGPDLVVTAAEGQTFDDHQTFWAPNGRAIKAETTIASPSLPVAAVHTLEEVVLPVAARLPIEFIAPGRWILALWRRETQEHAFVPGNFLGTQELRCWDSSYQEVVSTLVPSEAMAGGGVFDLDGNLLGLIAVCDGRAAVISADSVETALNHGESFDGRMATRYGMRVANLAEEERDYYGRKQGVIVKETWRGYRADQAGLLPGDVITTLDGKPVRSVDDLEVLVLPLAREIFELSVVRGSAAEQVRLRARPGPEHGIARTRSGLRLSAPPQGYLIDAVLPGSSAATAGIEPGDRLLKIAHQDPTNIEAVRETLAGDSDRPVHVVLQRDSRRWEAILR